MQFNTIKKCAFSFTLFAITCFCHATPCDGVNRTISAEEKLSIENSMAKTSPTKKAEIFEYMQVGSWRVIWVNTFDSEPGVLFFSGDPINSEPVTGWGGASIYGEEQEDINWAQNNAKGIPIQLAKCFAWRVSPDGREQSKY
jgi:hypothetical protein